MATLTWWDIEDGRLRIANKLRTDCFNSNQYVCSKCKKECEPQELFAVHKTNECYCKSCWVDGESIKKRKFL